MSNIVPVPRERRHTLHFLRSVRAASPVYLNTDVDASAIADHRLTRRRNGERSHYSVVTYVVRAAGVVLRRYPDANAAYGSWPTPRIAHYTAVDVKLTLDKKVNGFRSVVTVVIPRVDEASLEEIQQTIDRLRELDAEEIPELQRTRALQRLPWLVGRVAFRLATSLRLRSRSMGTVAVTSLGHRPVRTFFALGGTGVTLGVGQVYRTPVVSGGAIRIRPVLPLSLTFDHRVLDGALAADILTDLKEELEGLGGLVAAPADPVSRSDPAPKDAGPEVVGPPAGQAPPPGGRVVPPGEVVEPHSVP